MKERGGRVKLTIGIPVYNAERYIARSLNSVLQTEGINNYEIICVDDGSTDKSLEILKKYESAYDNINVISTENKGAFLARSRIIDEAQGEYVGFVDADDTIDSQMYEVLLRVAENQNIDMVVCAFNKIDLKSGKIKAVQMNFYGSVILDFAESPIDRGLLAGVNPAYWNKIYRKEKLKERLRLDYSPKIMEDYLFAASVFPFMDKVAFVDMPLYNYYDVPFSVTKQIGMNELRDAEVGLRELAFYLNSMNQFTDDIYKQDLVTAMTCVHLGIAFTINWNDKAEKSVKEIWINTKKFLDKEFAGWRNNSYISIKYIIRRKALTKLYLSNWLFRCRIWPVVVWMYHTLCRIVGKDLKW